MGMGPIICLTFLILLLNSSRLSRGLHRVGHNATGKADQLDDGLLIGDDIERIELDGHNGNFVR